MRYHWFVFSLLLFGMLPKFTAFAQDEMPDGSDTNDAAGQESASNDAESGVQTVPDEQIIAEKPEHSSPFSIFPKDKVITAKLNTSAGTLSCELFAGTHPLTVLNFISLAKGAPVWNDASGTAHRDPYYKDLPFEKRQPGTYVLSGVRKEGTNFVISDERCMSHAPKAGALAMVQPYPGMASAQFMLLAKPAPSMAGLYPIFGQCTPVETIDSLTRGEAVLIDITIEE